RPTPMRSAPESPTPESLRRMTTNCDSVIVRSVLISALIVMGAGVVLLLRPPVEAAAPDFPRGAALARVLGVAAGLAFMAASIPYLGFAVAGFVTMIILLRAVEKSGWVFSIALAFISVVVVVWLFGRVLGMTLPRGPWGW
ncbi:MAG: tripartite tricarboxylate transporter TctB family protein, partial [Xanthobacteraceae bacterium]